MTQQIEITDSIKTKKYGWSLYSFIVNSVSLTTLTVLIILLMIVHRMHNPNVNFENWVIIVVGISCEIAFLVGSFLDAKRRDPKERMFSSTIYNLPMFTLSTIIIGSIFWGESTQLVIMYGALVGAFAGHLSGALAYGDFFVRIENKTYRTIFGGWIAIPLGAILGAVFANALIPLGTDIVEYFNYYDLSGETEIIPEVNPIVGMVFAGVFMGFWGGVVSGVPAVLILYYLRNDIKFTSFFVKLQYYDIQKELSYDLEIYFSEGAKELNVEECKFFQDEVKKKREKLTDVGSKAAIVLFAMNFMIGLLFLTGAKIIRSLLFFMSPWEERDEKRIRKSYIELIDTVIEPLGLIRDEKIIKLQE